MAITATDIQFFLSGGAGNSNPNASLGGIISSTQITDASLHNLFDVVSGDEAAAGRTEFRAFYIKNNHGTLTWEAVKLWITSNTPSTWDQVQIGIEASSGSPKQTIANETTAPSSPTISFSEPTTKAGGLALGDMAAGVVYMVWVRRVVTAGAQAYNANAFTLQAEGDTAP
ncbi:MAG TPA: hypothetical protein VLH56_00145 [Dissulfurispiraceae bacterium]|nr:hypothetical protein [Dissulfurispiraceae bacterium]